MPHTVQHGAPSAEMQQCIDECLRCHSVCTTTIAYCLQQGGKHATPEHVTLLLDCAQISATSADYMLRGSHLHTRTCETCAEVCRACAEACERMGDDDVMRRCAELCRRCAESCERMAGAGARP